MRSIFLKLVTLLMFLYCLVLPVSATEIAQYDVTCELVEDGSGDYKNCEFRLDITYDIKQPKEGGFKFIGSELPKKISVFDENDHPLPWNIKVKDEIMLEWEFDETKNNGLYTVHVEFTQNDIVKGGLDKNTIRLKWPGNFKDTVHNATYTVIFPEGYKYTKIFTKPSFNKPEFVDGEYWIVSVNQSILKDKEFFFEYEPGLIKNPVNDENPLGFSPIEIFSMAFIIIVGAIIVRFIFRFFTGRGRRRGGGAGGFLGECDSCSSCSSCSSCGGCGGCGD